MALDFEAFKAYLESDGEIELDLYAQDPNEWSWLAKHIPGIVVYSAGGWCPFQAEGLIHGLPFYFREEDGHASISVGEADGEPFGDEVLYSASHVFGEEKNAHNDFVEMLCKLIPELKPASFGWKFECRKLIFIEDSNWNYIVSDTEKDELWGRGFTPSEGLAFTRQTSAYLEEYGCSAEKQEQMWLDKEVNPVPTNKDNRNWPAEAPVFEVKL